ncbi:mitochondrial amidoxime-reducing component 1-like [Gracilinanus agilis]|uniref:mitochondrial amidoxime-reducing component 1-like n=1 Tax=Gracilinanus agilis TaxID=191870 RepID=UPI001CFCAD8F|nr:mitochondrial amidoxime-reducing component 1-like [Gracilinanus agilis]
MGAATSSIFTGLFFPQLRLGLALPVSAQPRAAWLRAAVLGLTAAAALTAAAWSTRGGHWRWRRQRKRQRLQQVGTVAQLWIYPIKSCKGVPVNEAECTPMGLRSGHLRDRFWLIINEDGNMVTARQEPRLVLISLTCENDSLTLSAAYTQDLILPVKAPTSNVVRKCRIRGLEIEGRDCGDEAAQWITSFLKTQPYRLVHFEPHMRPRNSKQIESAFRTIDKVAYPDASPFLIISEASLADLNSRLEKKVKANNFRPNIVISGCGVFEESTITLATSLHHWKKISSVWEPASTSSMILALTALFSLCSYRQCDPSDQKVYGKAPLFGQYFVLEDPGTIKVGDPVYLLEQ